MRRRVTVQAFENTLEGIQGNISLYRRGINEFLLSYGFPGALEDLEAVRRPLERLGMYEVCREALVRAEALVRQGPDFDHEAEMLLLNANRALMQASGSYDAIARRFRPANEPKA